MSIVSVSLFAFPLHFGHLVLTNSCAFSKGFPSPVISTFSGSNTGNSFSGTGTIPHFSQYTIGIGVPQYLCLLISQSRILKFTVLFPQAFFSSHSAIKGRASVFFIPENSPELNKIPSSVNASSKSSAFVGFPSLLITNFNGMSYFLANLKSLLSWASHITIPEPYISAKFATKIGTLSLFTGLIAYFPVNTPDFSFSSFCLSIRLCFFASLMNNSTSSSNPVPFTSSGIIGCSGAIARKVTL